MFDLALLRSDTFKICRHSHIYNNCEYEIKGETEIEWNGIHITKEEGMDACNQTMNLTSGKFCPNDSERK